MPVRTQRGDHDGAEHQDGSRQSVAVIAVGIELSDTIVRVGLQKYLECEHVHAEPAEPGKEGAVREEHRALVVIRRQFGGQRRTRDFVERDEDAHDDGHDDEIKE